MAVCLRWWDPQAVFQLELFGHAVGKHLNFPWKCHGRRPRPDSDSFRIKEFHILQRRAQI